MDLGPSWRLGRRPALDGLRGVAALMVLVCHASLTRSATTAFFEFGNLGVTAFFTLSGFLITALLLEEHDRTGTISVRRFLGRRARRLLPALYVFVAAVAVCASLLGPVIATGQDLLASVLYFGNWELAYSHYMGALNHTWSLAVEEQFYLVWPLLLLGLLRWRSERTVLVAALVGAIVSVLGGVPAWLIDGPERVYFGSDTRAFALLFGVAAAVIVRRGIGVGALPRAATLLVVCLVGCGFVTNWDVRYLALPPVAAVLTALAILCLVRGDYDGWLAAPWLTWLGRRSYGLYLWHVLTLQVFAQLDWPWLPTVALGLSTGLVAALLSWRFVETPFLRRRRVPPPAPGEPLVSAEAA